MLDLDSRPGEAGVSEAGVDPSIGDYAIIGDCRTAALISRDGTIDWLCLPHFSASSVFAALLDRERGGRFGLRPSRAHTSRRRYLGATPILETVFHTEAGTVRMIDVMPVSTDAAGLRPMREVLRVIEGIEGAVEMEVQFEPRPDYARTEPKFRSLGALGWSCAWRDEILVLHPTMDLLPAADGRALTGRFRVETGQKHYLSLSYVKGDIGVIEPLGAHAEQRLRDTLRWWQEWSARCTYAGPYRQAVLRSAITLKLMTFALSGAVIAAPTTSLPEVVGSDRNWDYRYCWLRDAALTMRAFTGLGYREEAEAFLQWLLHATRLTWPALQVMYDVYGRTNLNEETLPHLVGYRHSRPVRIGNAAHSQVQLDVYGGVVSAALDFVENGGCLRTDEAKLLAGFGKLVCETWQEADHGIWEIRGPKRQYTFSKVMCWAALDGLIQLHEREHIRIDVERFRREREAIAATIETRGFDDAHGSYVGELDGKWLDASLLLMPSLGYGHASDPRSRGTFDRIRERLGRNGLLYRYEPSATGGGREATFGICSFWAIEHLAQQGEISAAERAFDHVLSFANDVGLFGEEIDADTGEALGNFPQAFTHVGLINAALALENARREARRA